MITLDAKHVLIKIVNLHLNKLESSNVHLHFFGPLSIVHNENEWSILLCVSQPINACIAKIMIANIFDFFGNVMEAWRDAWVDFILIRLRSLKILSSLVAHWVVLLITCSKYAPSNGVYKLNASYGVTNFRAMVKLPKLVPSFSHSTRFWKWNQNFQIWLSIASPTHPQ